MKSRAGKVAAAAGLSLVCVCMGDANRQKSVADVLQETRQRVESKYEPAFRSHGLRWPPSNLVLIAYKREKRLEIWVKDDGQKSQRIATFPILAASGSLGPKRREGDRQVPEGFYRLPYLNPNSKYHLSVFVDYPNAEDVTYSKVARSEMGGEIFVHGKAVSIGCLAMGDAGIEEIFTLCALTPAAKRRIIISPVDFREEPGFALRGEAGWVTALHARIRAELLSNHKL